jgi:hypothetical protein
MEKKVKRAEISMTVGKGSPSPTKIPAAGTGLRSSMDFPDADSLAQKYGVMEKPVVESPPRQSAAPNPAVQRTEMEMMRKLEDKNKKIEQLCVLLEALEPAPGVDAERIQKLLDSGIDENVDFRDAKIVNLAKKSHRLTMLLNKEKLVSEKLNQQATSLQKTIDNLNQELQSAKASSSNRAEPPKVYNRNTTIGGGAAGGEAGSAGGTSAEDYLSTIAGLTRDLKESTKTVDKLKRELAESTEENKQLSRALSRELGDGVSLEQAVSGGWRGRAQQIIMLKAKVRSLICACSIEKIGVACWF